MSEFDTDLFIIGAGSGGVRAARIAAEHGARVMVAEEYRVGGTCVIRGCVPKKLLVYASRFAYEFEEAEAFGWTIKSAKFDWPTLIANKDKEIARLEAAYRSTLGRNKVEIVESRAVVDDPHTVRILKTGARIRAGKILIATGGHPQMPKIPGVELAISSNEAFHLKKFPRRIMIVGGGYIGLEFAGIFSGLGAHVTLVHRGDEILRGFDDDVRHHVRVEMEQRGIHMVLRHTVASIEKKGRALCARLSDGVTHEVDQIMFATGRRANSANMGLEEAGVAVDARGAIAVDENSRTTIPSIFAIGDVTDRLQLTPVAIREGHAFADSAFGDKPWSVDLTNVPTAVFSEPEIGVVGLSEADAKSTGKEIDIYRTSFRPMKSALSGRATTILMKLVVDRETDRVLGVHIVGEGAAEMVQMVAIAVKMGAKKPDLDATVALHPSAAEELVTLRAKV
jgi:glutathione reductase (NADPH)